MSDPRVDLGSGVKGKIKLFQNMVMLHIKLKGITGAATCNMVANILPAAPLSPQKVIIQLFSEHGYAAHQRNRECSNMVATADRGTINMKHIKRDFGSKTCAGPPGWT